MTEGHGKSSIAPLFQSRALKETKKSDKIYRLKSSNVRIHLKNETYNKFEDCHPYTVEIQIIKLMAHLSWLTWTNVCVPTGNFMQKPTLDG